MSNRTTRSSDSGLEFEMGKNGAKSAEITKTAFERVKKEKNVALKSLEETAAKLKMVESEKEKLMSNFDVQKAALDAEKIEMKEKLDSEIQKWQHKYYKMKQKHLDDKSKYATLLSEKTDIESQLESLNSKNEDLQKQMLSLRQENGKLSEEMATLTSRVENLQKSKKIVEEKKRSLLKELLRYKDAVLISKLKSDGVYLPRRQTRYYDSEEEFTSKSKYDDHKRREHPKPYDDHRVRPRYY